MNNAQPNSQEQESGVRHRCLTVFSCRRFLRTLATVVVLYLAAEGLAWIVWRAALPAETRQAIADIRGPFRQPLGPHGLIPHPYMLLQMRPAYVEGGVVQTGAAGWRGGEVAQEKPPGTLRVACLGGSTTYGLGVVRPEDAYPARLEVLLRAASDGGQVEVINCGIPRASSAELFGAAAFRVIHLNPDLIVLETGLEDVNALLAEGYQDDYTHWRKSWIAPTYGTSTARLLTSPLYRLVFVAFRLPHRMDRQFQYRADPSWDDPARERIARRDPSGFRTNVGNILSVTVGRGIPVLLVTERLSRAYPHVEWALARHRDILDDLAARYDAPLLRLDAEPVPDDCWTGEGFLNARGNELKADLIARAIVRRRLLAAPRPAMVSPAGAAPYRR